MFFQEKLSNRIKTLRSFLCIGLDPDFDKLPPFVREKKEPLFEFCKEIVRKTHSYAIAYKPNIAFFERFGSKGFIQLEKLLAYIRKVEPHILIVLDAKRGDLANTSKEYAKYYFRELKVDSVTINPYMGRDSIEPYLNEGGHVFSLCLTSNPGAYDLQYLKLNSGRELFVKVAEYINLLNKEYENRFGLVVGANHKEEIARIREIAPKLCFLMPGLGAQGATLQDIFPYSGQLVLINSSREILFISQEEDFSEKSREKAKEISNFMRAYYDPSFWEKDKS